MFKLKFRTKLIIIFVIALITQGIVIGFFSNYYAKEIVLRNKQKDMAGMINLIDININTRVRYITKLIENTANSRIVRDFFYGEANENSIFIAEYFKNLDSELGAMDTIIILDEANIVFSQSAKEELSDNALGKAKSSDAYQKAVSNPQKVNWIGASDSIVNDLTVVTVSCAVLDNNLTDILGVLIVELDSVAFSNLLLNNNNTFQKQYTYIIDKNREIVGKNKIVNEEWIDIIADKFDNGTRKFEIELENNTYYVCGQYNGITGWETFSVLSTNHIFPQADILKKLIMLIVAFCTCCVSIIIMAVSYTMTRPVNKLSDAMKCVQNGDFTIRLNSRRKDEMGMLMTSFDFMLVKINTLICEVYQEKIAQKNAEMEALEARINPHFLYNTLDSINWMLIDKEEYEISEVIVSLGDLLKYCVDKSNSIVKLEQEIDYIISYLLIQKTRLEDRLDYHIRIPEYLKALHVPKLILQPLVENAIIHGIEPFKEGGVLDITAYESTDILYIEVEDNGCGMYAADLERIRDGLRHNGYNLNSIGIYNVDKRLRLYYGEAYGLEIASRIGHGTKLTIRIPKERQVKS